jgi:2-methylisocitrate lyase-like PEP mutase family enzyme
MDELDVAVERVAAAVEEAGRHGMVLTARCDNHSSMASTTSTTRWPG